MKHNLKHHLVLALTLLLPLAALNAADNSALVKSRYTALGGSMQLIVPLSQGHNMWQGFFQCEELVAFIKTCAKP